MRYLKTNTAVIVTVGPFYDKADGVTIEGSLTITNERITLTADTDDGNAPTLILDNVTGATSATDNDLNYITNTDAGLMQLELSAANTNRLGRMFLTITDAANHVPVFHEFMVLSAAAYDWMFGATIPPVNATQFAGQTITAAAGVTLPASVASPTNITAGTITTVTTVTGLTASDVGAIKAKTDNLPTDPADESLIIAATDAILADSSRSVAMTEGYAADGVAPTQEQMLFMIWSALAEFAIATTTITAKKLDGTTTAMTFTLDDATNPTSRTRAS